MEGYGRRVLLFVILCLLGTSGASCWRREQFPRVLPPSPTLEQVIDAVNRNNGAIESFTATQASLSGPGMPTLRASMVFQRPKRLRLRADLLGSPEIDLGSNDELFWFWVKRGEPAALFYCRHERFAESSARRLMPVDPQWLIEALGIGLIDPALPHQGPLMLPGNRLEIRTITETSDGPTTKVTILDASQGWILEQRLHDAQGRVIAASATGRHKRDPLTGLFIPTVVQASCPAAQFYVRLDLGNVQVNRLPPNQAELWTMPNYPGYPLVDLADPRMQLRPTNAQRHYTVPGGQGGQAKSDTPMRWPR